MWIVPNRVKNHTLWEKCFIYGHLGWRFRVFLYLCSPTSWKSSRCIFWFISHNLHDRRAETHERFYSIEVHRHRFARHARKVPFEKCEHWRKVCGRSAKDQIASILYNKFLIRNLNLGKCNPYGTAKAGERFAQGLRKGGSWELLFSTTFTCISWNSSTCVVFHQNRWMIQGGRAFRAELVINGVTWVAPINGIIIG